TCFPTSTITTTTINPSPPCSIDGVGSRAAGSGWPRARRHLPRGRPSTLRHHLQLLLRSPYAALLILPCANHVLSSRVDSNQ
uniref:Uncharacterized protein n=1 Tax=Triticum urartu TaxID=4572 RepID=A0A8R7P1N0_TRIUA